jgi:hypothetical protein
VTQRIHDASHVPDLLLERYRLGELSPAEIERLRLRLEGDEGLRARLRALDDSDAEIGRCYPPGWLAERVRQRLRASAPGPSPSVSRLSWRLPIAVAAAAVVVLGVGWRLFGPLHLQPAWWMTSDSAEPADRIKGHKLVLFRKTAQGSEVLGDGALVRAGDRIRIGYRAAGGAYGVILSIDGRGVVMRHFPQQGDRAALIARNGQVLLDHAYELDDAPGWERFYLVTGSEAFDVGPVLEAAWTLAAGAGARPPGPLTLSASLDQSSLVLMKEVER